MASPLSTVAVSTADGQSLTHSQVPGWEISFALPEKLPDCYPNCSVWDLEPGQHGSE